MASETQPSEDMLVSQVMEFANLSSSHERAVVIKALKDNNNNVERVISDILEHRILFREQQEFDIESGTTGVLIAQDDSLDLNLDDTTKNAAQAIVSLSNARGSAAPSRPPSRSNDPSLPSIDAHALPLSQSFEEEDIRQALRESVQEAGIRVPDQQSGVMDTVTPQGPAFGPATRTDYDHQDWAMVPSGSSATRLSEVKIAPSLRKRTPGAPAFLVQGATTTYPHGLGGMLTVLHEIPMARNALLRVGTPAASYGFNSEWWNGQEILSIKVHTELQSEKVEWVQTAEKPDIGEEIHRLMAFLDSTERSYGTISVLVDLLPYADQGPERQFFEHLGASTEMQSQPLLHSVNLVPVHDDNVEGEIAHFGLLEVDVNPEEYTHVKTMYEALDHIMWRDAISDAENWKEAKMAMFGTMGEVLSIKVQTDDSRLSFEVPEKLYLERYQPSRKDEARRVQAGWRETKRHVSRLNERRSKLQEWRNDENQLVDDQREMLQKATRQWRVYREYIENLGRFEQMKASKFDTDRYPTYRMAPAEIPPEYDATYKMTEEVLKLTESASADLDCLEKAFDAPLERIQAKQRFLGRLLTNPNKAGRPKPMTCKEYLLRGVVSGSDIVYVCQQREVDLIELEDEQVQRPQDQWWRLVYENREEHQVKAEKVEVSQVLAEVWQHSKRPLMIYATEEALKAPRTPLSMPLRQFVRAENMAFRQELNREAADSDAGRKPPGPAESLSPSKRKHRADSGDSMDSMDSNCASMGSADDQTGFQAVLEEDSVSTDVNMESERPLVEKDESSECTEVESSRRLHYAGEP